MDDRPLIYALAHCYHEAGHAVAFWHFGIEFSHVTLNPPANSGHFGQTVLFDREIVGLAQIEAEMQCAVAGEIAAHWLVPPRRELEDEHLIRSFTRDAATVDANADFAVTDGRNFAMIGRERDAEIGRTDPDAATGPDSWLPIFRRAQQLIRVELWSAVHVVAQELCRSATDLRYEDVAALAAAALASTEA